MTIRDAERFKDKLEVSLDGRQVFFLFFGGAVLACLVFVLGVMVGKRLEGRERVARKAVTSTAIDPLAALDELGADEAAAPDDLAFPAALAGEPKAKARALDAADLAPARSLAPDGTGAAMQAVRAAAAKLADAKPPEPPKPEPAAVAAPSAAPAAAAAAVDDRKFTLQISSFQERAEADALVAKLSSMGYKPYVVMSDVPDKGLFFRVRIGEFSSRSEALVAKEDFEKKERIIAYVTKI
jgi:cell division septation protein DedD